MDIKLFDAAGQRARLVSLLGSFSRSDPAFLKNSVVGAARELAAGHIAAPVVAQAFLIMIPLTLITLRWGTRTFSEKPWLREDFEDGSHPWANRISSFLFAQFENSGRFMNACTVFLMNAEWLA